MIIEIESVPLGQSAFEQAVEQLLAYARIRDVSNWVTNSIFSGERPIATNVVGGTDR